jgi:hypothetical protein
VSYSLREPEEPATCECKYDEIHDWMDREDCPFHLDLDDARLDLEQLCTKRKCADTEKGTERPAKTA